MMSMLRINSVGFPGVPHEIALDDKS